MFNIQNTVNAFIVDSKGLMITERCSCVREKLKFHDFSKTFSEFTKFHDFSRPGKLHFQFPWLFQDFHDRGNPENLTHYVV